MIFNEAVLTIGKHHEKKKYNSLTIPSHTAMVSFSVTITDNRLTLRQVRETLLVSNSPGLTLGLNPYSVQSVPKPVSPGVTQPGGKADRSLPSSAEVNNTM